jgi:hypothetical protein
VSLVDIGCCVSYQSFSYLRGIWLEFSVLLLLLLLPPPPPPPLLQPPLPTSAATTEISYFLIFGCS